MNDPERRLHGAAEGFEPDRDTIWRQINLGIDEPRAVRRRGPYVWPLSVAASAALVILGINVLGDGSPQGAPQDGVVGAPVEASMPFGASAASSAAASSSAGRVVARSTNGPSAGVSPSAASTAPVTASSGASAAGRSSASAAARVTISAVPAPDRLAVTLPLTAGRPWFAAAPIGTSSPNDPSGTSGAVSAGFGVGPLQVNGVSSATATSPFLLSWAGGSPTVKGANNSGWTVLSASVASGQASLRVPLRPLGPPGTFKVYLATLGGGAHVSVTGLGAVVDYDLRDCGAATCPVVLTIAVSGGQRGDGSLDITPTGGGGVGIAAAAQQS